MTGLFVRVAVDQPMPGLFDYRYALPDAPVVGMLVKVPFGRREVGGLICESQTWTRTK